MKYPSLAAMVDSINAKISRQSLHYRFTSKAVKYMIACAHFIVKQKINSFNRLKSIWLKPFNRIIIVDSSGWDVSPKMCKSLPGYGGSASSAYCKIQVVYEYKHGEMAFFDLTGGTVPDCGYAQNLAAHVQKGDLWISDLGYFVLQRFFQIHKKGAYFLSRFSVGTALFDAVSEKPIQIEKILKNYKGNACELSVRMGASKKTRVPCRLIALRVCQETADRRRQKLRKAAKKRGNTPSRQHLNMCDWTLMITNAPERILPAERVGAFYTLRWQIELLFKQLKSVLCINYSNTGNENRLI